MNWMMQKRKLLVKIRRTVNRLKRKFRKPIGQDITEKRKAINLELGDFINMFNPRICHILCAVKGRNKSFLAPIKAITEITTNPYRILFPIIRGSVAEKFIKKFKCFSINQVPIEYAQDFNRMVKMLPESGTIEMVMRFRAEKAFFINGYKVQNLPWMECELEKIIGLDSRTALVVGKVIHISKKQNSNKEKLMHYDSNLFVNTKIMSIKPVEKL